MNQSICKNSSELKIVSIFGLLFLAMIFAPNAIADGEFVKACEKVDGFFKNFQMILKVVSIGIVTIAIVFAGYQIAFAHKRLSDVAPILIGGLLIGGAATIAGWFVGDFASTGCVEAGFNFMSMVFIA